MAELLFIVGVALAVIAAGLCGIGVFQIGVDPEGTQRFRF